MKTFSDPLAMTRAAWRDLAAAWGLPAYRGDQIFEGLHRPVSGYGEIRTVPRELRERLSKELPWSRPEIVRRESSSDGSVKYGLRLADGALIESVFMPGEGGRAAVNEFADARAASSLAPSPRLPVAPSAPGSSFPASPRPRVPLSPFTICLSSQTGCSVDCAFCVTGRLGGGRNLSAGEIVGQLYAVLLDSGRSREGLRVVFMGMGEPFLNPDGVLGALDVLFELLSPRRVTVSTSGITPGFARFRSRERLPNLAVSINAADEETRARLMPITRTYPLSEVISEMRAWPADSRRPITAEYVLIAGVNDSPEEARRLSRLLRGVPVKVNLIPLNEDPIYLPGWKRPDERSIDRFAAELRDAGARVTIRRSKGPDAGAACGQLKGRTADVRQGGRQSSVLSSQSSSLKKVAELPRK